MKHTKDEKESLDFQIIPAFAALSRQQYKEALRLIRKGLENSIEAEERIDIRKVLISFDVLFSLLNENLEEAYGEDWEDKIEIPKIEQKEIRCSFCGKAQAEVTKIIAGPSAYICNECIAICNEIMTERD